METLDIVIPVFNEEDCIEELCFRLMQLRDKMKPTLNIRLIFVDDGSTDNTVSYIEKIANKNRYFSLLKLSRNFGHQIAVSAGLDNSTSDFAAIIDADLQDPPELLSDMYELLSSGYDVVYGKRKSRSGETLFKRLTAKYFYKTLSNLCDIEIPRDTGDFRIMTKRVVDEFRNMREKHRFVRGMVPWIGFKSAPFLYDRQERYAGETKYPLSKMISFAVNAIFSFSKKPLVFATKIGLYSIFIALIMGLYILYLKLFTEQVVEGLTIIILTIIFIGGLQIFITGVIGEYIARIFEEVKDRPLYVIDKKINL